MSKRGRVTVDQGGDWQKILPVLPRGYTAVGTVQVSGGELGVLAQSKTGEFLQLMANGTQLLDQRKVRTALGLPQSVGKPRAGYEVREIYSIRLEPSLADYLRALGQGNLSAGITVIAEQHRGRAARCS